MRSRAPVKTTAMDISTRLKITEQNGNRAACERRMETQGAATGSPVNNTENKLVASGYAL